MSRNISLVFRQALFAQESGEVPIFLLTITHESLDEPIYLSTDPTERSSEVPLIYKTVSRGIDFIFAGPSITIPSEEDKSPPSCQLILQNVDRSLIPLARSINSPASVKIEVVLASDPDTVEMTWPALDMSSVQYAASQLVFDLTMDALVTEPFPAGSFTPANFPGLFY